MPVGSALTILNDAPVVALLFGIVASLSTAQPALPPSAPSSLQRAKEQIVECGVPVTRVTIRDQPSLKDHVIAVAAGRPLGDEQFACISRASMETLAYVEFEEVDQDKRFRVVYGSILDAEGNKRVQDARAAAGLANKVPTYHPKRQSLASYGRSLEGLCGISRGHVLTVKDDTLTFLPEVDKPRTGKLFDGRMTGSQLVCILLVGDGPNVGEHGLSYAHKLIIHVK